MEIKLSFKKYDNKNIWQHCSWKNAIGTQAQLHCRMRPSLIETQSFSEEEQQNWSHLLLNNTFKFILNFKKGSSELEVLLNLPVSSNYSIIISKMFKFVMYCCYNWLISQYLIVRHSGKVDRFVTVK